MNDLSDAILGYYSRLEGKGGGISFSVINQQSQCYVKVPKNSMKYASLVSSTINEEVLKSIKHQLREGGLKCKIAEIKQKSFENLNEALAFINHWYFSFNTFDNNELFRNKFRNQRYKIICFLSDTTGQERNITLTIDKFFKNRLPKDLNKKGKHIRTKFEVNETGSYIIGGKRIYHTKLKLDGDFTKKESRKIRRELERYNVPIAYFKTDKADEADEAKKPDVEMPKEPSLKCDALLYHPEGLALKNPAAETIEDLLKDGATFRLVKMKGYGLVHLFVTPSDSFL